MTVRAIAIAAFGLCVAALAYVLMTARAPMSFVAATVARDSMPLAAVLPALRPAEPFARRLDAPALAPWSPQDAPAIVAQRWHAAANKREFFERAVATGGGAYLHFAGKALAACGSVNRLGVIGAEQRFGSSHRASDPTLPRRIEAFRASIAGCDAFESRAVGADEESALFQRLVASGDLVGRIYAHKLWALTATRSEDARATLVQALDARDPELLQLIYPAIVARGFAARGQGETAADDMQDELNAWRWALCDLGADCSPGSAQGRSLCAGRGLCEWASVDEIAQAAYPGATAERRDEIVARVRAGDWSKLGL